MIQYALKCSEGHSFDSWFQSAEAFDKLAASGMVACAVCGSVHVEKAIMTPSVRPSRKDAQASEKPDLTKPKTDVEAAMQEMRRHVEKNADYVGMEFAQEARAIHDGDKPERAIYGEARPDEAKKLLEDGVPVAPLPFLPPRKTN